MKRIVACTSLAALALSACGSDDGGISIEGAWARTSAEGQTTGAVYFHVTADEDDRLVAVSVPASVAATAEIHEVVMADMSEDAEADMGDDMSEDAEADTGGTDPQMRMQELADGLPLPAGGMVTLEPGGYHVMLLDIAEPLAVGDEIELTLDFEHADDVTVTVEVAESAP
jgi:copper(I)-binding protein